MKMSRTGMIMLTMDQRDILRPIWRSSHFILSATPISATAFAEGNKDAPPWGIGCQVPNWCHLTPLALRGFGAKVPQLIYI